MGASVRMEGYYSSEQMIARLHLLLRGRLRPVLLLGGVLLMMGGAALLVNPSGTNRTTAQGPASDPSTASLTATRNRLASPPQSRTATHAPAPSPSHTRTPPPPSGYFGLRPVGSWSSLPSDAQCAAQVHHSTWEPRPENYQQNHSKPAPGAMAASFSSRPRARGGSYNALWDSWLLPRVDGQFTGTTDEILQWAACKWGLPDNLIRAEAAVESTWFQYLHFPQDASYGGGGGGSCYWTRGCGDAFSSPTAASVAFCNGIASEGLLPSEIHNYQKDPVTTAGGYPATPTSGLCPKTFSILGVMSWDDPAWESPYPAYSGNQNGTFPFIRDSTAAAADYWGAYIRGCYEGWVYWLKSSGTGTYAAGDLWGCVGLWYSGDWHGSAANSYIANAQLNENSSIWLTADFGDSRQHYHCDTRYGCPN